MSAELSAPLLKIAPEYKTWGEVKQRHFLEKAYDQENVSIGQIARSCGISPTTVKKHLAKYGVRIKTISESRAILVKEGRSNLVNISDRPDIKEKIGRGVTKHWLGLSPEEKEVFSQRKKDYWAANQDKIEEITKEGMKAIRATHRTGSKLEKFVAAELVKAGYLVETHKKRQIVNKLFHLDIFLPQESIAIEIDGILHHTAMVGEDELKRTKLRDRRKNGLLLGSGCSIIRVQYRRKFSAARARHVVQYVLAHIKRLVEKAKDIDFEPELVMLEHVEWNT
jgi:very-short-patch-repair endonuclease